MTTPHHLAARYVLIPFAIALLLLARPYEGIDRDDALYLGQVLQSASQPQLGTDLFFASGSQNDYALYARVVAPLYEAFGIAATHMGLLGLSWLATLAALLHLQRRLGVEDAHLRLLGLVCLVAASPFYGGLRKFGVLEPFLTARTLAEPLVVGSLALLSMSRLGAAVAMQLAAALLHPLMALPALLMTWLLAVARNRRWLALAAAPIVLLVLAALGMVPERLIQRYDTAWWDLVATRNAQVVLGNWTLPDWLTVATDALLVALAALAPPLAGGRRVLLALLAASGLLLTVNLLGTDLWQAVFITQLQPWRSLGLLHLAAWVLTPFVLWHTWQRGPMGRLCAAALALAQVSSHAGSSYGLPILFVWALCQVAAVRGLMATPAMYRLALGASALGALALSCADVLARLERLHWHPTVSLALDEASRIATEPLIALTLAGLVLWGAARHAAARRLGWGLGLALLVFAAAHWDRRDALARAVEQPPEPRPFQDVVPPDASVYWPEHLAAVWGPASARQPFRRTTRCGPALQPGHRGRLSSAPWAVWAHHRSARPMPNGRCTIARLGVPTGRLRPAQPWRACRPLPGHRPARFPRLRAAALAATAAHVDGRRRALPPLCLHPVPTARPALSEPPWVGSSGCTCWPAPPPWHWTLPR